MIKHRIRSADNVLWIELTSDSWIPVTNKLDEINHDSIHEFISDNFTTLSDGSTWGIITYHTRSFHIQSNMREYEEIAVIE